MWTALAIMVSVITVCIFFIVFFRKNIGSFIDRTKGVKYGQAEVQADSLPKTPTDAKAGSTEKLMQALDNPVLREQEELIKDMLKRANVTNSPDKEKVLIRYLAATHLQLLFTQIASAIWGSQVKILEFLNSTPNVPKQAVKSFYDSAAINHPEFFAGYSYDEYLGWLKKRVLILEQNESLSITHFGVEFLGFLTRTGQSGARFRYG